jgi:asparagine synthase (glutamine-hydrolysing)
VCALAGVVGLAAPLEGTARLEVDGLLAHMHHRGPDHRGIECVGADVVLGTNRLAITDPANPDAHMPMSSPDGRLHVALNGEIYNFRALRRELAWPFRTASDTEVVLAAYERWGMTSFDRFRGMFALAIVDAAAGRVVLAVDPSGQKPLLWRRDGASLVFASELGALAADRFRGCELDPIALAAVAAVCYPVGSSTHVVGVTRVEPGTCVVIEGGDVRVERWWRAPLVDRTGERADAAVARVRQSVEASCAATATGLEVPAGVLLSGGIDSTAVLAGTRPATGPVDCWSVGFGAIDGAAFQPTVLDEFAFSTEAADRFDCPHRAVRLGPDDYFRHLDRWLDLIDEPLASREGASLCAVVEAASASCRVLLCGSGADEAFGGYRYGDRIAARGAVHRDDVVDAYIDAGTWLFDVELARLMPDVDVLPRLRETFGAILAAHAGPEPDPHRAVQLLDLFGRCVTYEHRQVDAVTMAFSVEARAPLAERDVIEAALVTAPGTRRLGGRRKGVFVEAVRPLVPPSIADRPKAGFPVPSQLWSTPRFAAAIERVLEPGGALDSLGIFDLAYLRTLATSDRPSDRNVFFRLVVIDAVVAKQARRGRSPAPAVGVA